MTGMLDEDTTLPAWGHARALLLSNPDLMLDDTQLLQALGLRPHAANVLDFGPAALARLQADKAREVTAREEVEQLARANYTAQVETHAMVVDLLEATGNADLANLQPLVNALREMGMPVAADAAAGHLAFQQQRGPIVRAAGAEVRKARGDHAALAVVDFVEEGEAGGWKVE